MPWLPAVLAVVSTVATVASGVQQAKEQRRQAAITEKVAEYNAKVTENQAIQAEMEDREQSRRDRVMAHKILGESRAAIGASGVTTAGSPLEVLGETAGMLELQAQDASRASEAALRRGKAAATMTRYEGYNQATGLRNAAKGTILSTIGDTASSIYGFNKAGAFKFSKGKG